jgi:competence protein ComGC
MENDTTSTPPTQSESNRLGVIGLIVSIVGVCLCGFWLLTIPGLILSLIGLRKEPRTAAIAGSIFGGIGILEFLVLGPLLLGIFLPALAGAMEKAKEIKTVAIIQHIENASTLYKTDNGTYPTSFNELEQGDFIMQEDTKDAWGHEFTFDGGGSTKPVIKSAGSDGEWGTEDDLSIEDKDK